MKVVHLCLGGSLTDGWSYQDNLLPKYHRKMGYEVTVIASRWAHKNNSSFYKFPKQDYFLDDGIHMIRLEIKNKDTIKNRFKKYEHVYESIEKESPDILFVHGCQYLDIRNVVRYAKKNPKVIIYVDNHADYSNSASNFISQKILHGIIWKKCAKSIEPYTKKFYGVLPARVDFLKNVYKIPEEKIELLVMGADDEKIMTASKKEATKIEIRRKYGIAEQDFLIVTGGKIDLAKTQTLLLMEAVRKIPNSKIRLVVFGSVVPELQDKVNELADGKKVQYIGWLNTDESYPVFSAADLVAFPGRHSVFWEQVAGQGIPMLVKYWEGTNHIACDGSADFLYEDSVDEIQSKILSIAESGKYNMMKEAAQRNSINFLYSTIAKKSLELM